MHFLSNSKKKTRLTLLTVAVMGAMIGVGSQMITNTSPFTQTVFAKKKPPKKKKTKKVKNQKPHKFHPFSGHTPSGWGNFKVATGGTSQVGDDYASTYIIFNNSASDTIPEGGRASAWGRLKSDGDNNTGKNYFYNFHDDSSVRAHASRGNSSNIRISDHPSVVYKNMARVYKQNKDHELTEKPVNVDMRVTVIGFYPTRWNASNQKNTSVVFRGNQPAIKSAATGKLVLSYQFLKHNTNSPIQFDHTPISAWDIDAGQSLGMYDAGGHPYWNVVTATKNHTIPKGLKLAQQGRLGASTMLAGVPRVFHKGANKIPASQGNVTEYDDYAGLTWIIKNGNSFQIAFEFNLTKYAMRGKEDLWIGNYGTNGQNSGIQSSSTGSHVVRHPAYKKLPGITKHNGLEYYFKLNSNYSPGSDTPNGGGPSYNMDKTVKENDGGISSGYQKSLKLSKPFNKQAPQNTHWFYRMRINSTYPKVVGSDQKKKAFEVLKNFGFQDKSIDKGLDFNNKWTGDLYNGVAVYTQDTKDDKFKRISSEKVKKTFVITRKKNKNGTTSLTAKLRKPVLDTMLSSKSHKDYDWLFNHVINFVFKVQGNNELWQEFEPDAGGNYKYDLYSII